MREVTATITQRSQVTIPAEVRRVLGLKPRDKVTFTIEDNQVRLTSVPFSLESAYGSVKPAKSLEDFDEASGMAKESKAEKTLRELSRS